MKKVNFQEFKVFQNIEKTDTLIYDIRKDLSDLLYRLGDGMLAHKLCHTIFESQGEIELDQEQADYLIRFAGRHCTPAIITSLNEALNIKS